MDNSLIYDVGFHVGQDTDYYLRKGFRVIAIDANPLLIADGNENFKEQIASKDLILLNVGIGSYKGVLPFYVNKALSEWSSFDKEIGTTRGDYEVIYVQTATLRSIFEEYGVPYYIKIDIEGHDLLAVESLRTLLDKPKYISVENGQEHIIEELFSQGYRRFKFVNQANVHEVSLTSPAREGKYIDYSFPFGSSGPFGDEIEGNWLDKSAVISLSREYWGNPNRDANIHGWFDLHAAL